MLGIGRATVRRERRAAFPLLTCRFQGTACCVVRSTTNSFVSSQRQSENGGRAFADSVAAQLHDAAFNVLKGDTILGRELRNGEPQSMVTVCQEDRRRFHSALANASPNVKLSTDFPVGAHGSGAVLVKAPQSRHNLGWQSAASEDLPRRFLGDIVKSCG